MHAPVKTGNQIADPTGEVNADEAEQRTSDSGPHDTEHDVQEKPHLALHELLCEPTGNSAYDDGCNPADLLFFHWSPLLSGQARLSKSISIPTLLLSNTPAPTLHRPAGISAQGRIADLQGTLPIDRRG